jgi:rubrerythrin
LQNIPLYYITLVKVVINNKITLKGGKMLSSTPIDLNKVQSEDKDKEILRLGIIAELDAVSLYEQLANQTDNYLIKKVLLDIAKEEKTHIGEFQALLLKLDAEQVRELKAGEEEVNRF